MEREKLNASFLKALRELSPEEEAEQLEREKEAQFNSLKQASEGAVLIFPTNIRREQDTMQYYEVYGEDARKLRAMGVWSHAERPANCGAFISGAFHFSKLAEIITRLTEQGKQVIICNPLGHYNNLSLECEIRYARKRKEKEATA